MKRLLISTLLISLFFGLVPMDAAANEVAILVCRSFSGFGTPTVDVVGCSISAGARVACPVDPDPTNYLINASCSQALADFTSASFKIVATLTGMAETTYTLVKETR